MMEEVPSHQCSSCGKWCYILEMVESEGIDYCSECFDYIMDAMDRDDPEEALDERD